MKNYTFHRRMTADEMECLSSGSALSGGGILKQVLVPGLVRAMQHIRADVRKGAVFALVDIRVQVRIGSDMRSSPFYCLKPTHFEKTCPLLFQLGDAHLMPMLTSLNDTQRRLLDIYYQRVMVGGSLTEHKGAEHRNHVLANHLSL